MYARHESAKAAIEALNTKRELRGSTLFVMKHIAKSANQPSGKMTPISRQMKDNFQNNICVMNIPKHVTEPQFREAMAKCGKIISLRLQD